MAVISRLWPGQTLFWSQRHKVGNTTMSQASVYRVQVIEVDPEGRFVVASWNGNAPEKFYEGEVARWKVKDPREKTRA